MCEGMGDLLERLRARGWRLTAQRRVIAEALSGDDVHLTADEVHERAGGALPELSKATVYNTLNELVGLGEVKEISPDGRVRRYDPNAHHPHQHLLCAECGAIRDVTCEGDPLDILPGGERRGFRVHGADIVYRGVCPGCAGR